MSAILDTLSSRELLGIALTRYALAFLVILFGAALRRVFTSLVVRWIRHFTKKTATDLDDTIVVAIAPPIDWGFLIASLFIAANVLQLPDEPVRMRFVTFSVLNVAAAADITWLLLRLIDGLSTFYGRIAAGTDSQLDDQLIPVLRKALKTFVAVVAFLFVVQNLGYSVASLLAGLGIGGLAVALAAKDTLSNLFASVAILIDRPFAVGDWIETDGHEGVVEDIGLRSTRIRSFAKTQISVPNSTLANAVVNNWSRMPVRRVKQFIGVTYDSTSEQMEKAVEGIRDILKNHPEVWQDFSLVNFRDFNSSSLDIMVYYFTSTTAWAEHLRIRQEVNLAMMKLVESLGMSIAFPTRTVHLHNEETGT